MIPNQTEKPITSTSMINNLNENYQILSNNPNNCETVYPICVRIEMKRKIKQFNCIYR